MSTNMELIEAKTLTSATPSITFSSIPQTYTDLKILVSARDDRSGQPNTDLSLQVGYNGTINTGSIYTNLQLYGNGSTAGSQSSSTTYAYLGMSNGPTSTANTFGNTEIYIPNYTSANNKSVSTDGVSENNATTAYAVLNANLISTSNPITDIKISAVYGSGNFESGSTFYLYGISNVTSTTKATGGIVSSDGTYNYHMFPYSGTFTPTQNITADVLVIAGGGAGGLLYAGGGGAGGVSYQTGRSITTGAKTVTVGAGGAASTTNPNTGASGSNSVFDTITSNGGGGGAGWISSIGTNGVAGGSGGGGSMGTSSGNTTSGGATTQGNSGGATGYGFAGGGGLRQGSAFMGGGGGGAGAAGSNATASQGGAGGNGLDTWSAWAIATQTGVNGYYAGGGGGAAEGAGTAPAGGAGGGGNGQLFSTVNATSGTTNTGSGGGGVANNATPGSGGSGLVIIRYAI